MTKVLRGASQNLKRLARVQKLGILFALAPILVPVTAATAAPTQISQPAQPTVLERSVAETSTANIVETSSQSVKIELADSAYQTAQKEKQKQWAALQAVKVVIFQGTPDPGAAEKQTWVQRAAAAYGIDWKILQAVWQVESGQTWYTNRGSSAGASGPCQFMPGTWLAYAQDGNGDGVKDKNDARDCLFGAAKLLATNGAASGNVYQALFSYNHADWYVRKVLAIAGQ